MARPYSRSPSPAGGSRSLAESEPASPIHRAIASRAARCSILVAVALAIGCQDTDWAPLPPDAASSLPRPVSGDGGVERWADASPADDDARPPLGGARLRVMAANISSGTSPTYEPGEGIRMFQGLRPDIALVQELLYKSNSEDDLRELVDTAFGTDFSFYVEPAAQIPNGVVSRYPILEAGEWSDPQVDNRSFVWAKIAVPGPHPLWAVSVHLLTTGAQNRNAEARALVRKLHSVVADEDYVVIGGDFNTRSRSETCLTTLAEIVETGGPFPVDQDGDGDTNANRNEPYDWVTVDRKLARLEVPMRIGANEFPSGLVFDSRVYEPLVDVAPVKRGDSAAVNMQHMPVLKEFELPQD